MLVGVMASDLLTTLVAAELLAGLDPTYDPAPTARWFASSQRADGWWRACGSEATWLTVEILAWLMRADRPFSERFTWPHLAVTNRDRKTGLPFYGYFADLERLFDAVPGLSRAPIDIAFIDLAGFGVFNHDFGMEGGDRVLRTFAQALDRIPGSMAIPCATCRIRLRRGLPPVRGGQPGRMTDMEPVPQRRSHAACGPLASRGSTSIRPSRRRAPSTSLMV
jgi:hypothetical protein